MVKIWPFQNLNKPSEVTNSITRWSPKLPPEVRCFWGHRTEDWMSWVSRLAMHEPKKIKLAILVLKSMAPHHVQCTHGLEWPLVVCPPCIPILRAILCLVQALIGPARWLQMSTKCTPILHHSSLSATRDGEPPVVVGSRDPTTKGN